MTRMTRLINYINTERQLQEHFYHRLVQKSNKFPTTSLLINCIFNAENGSKQAGREFSCS